MRTTSAHFIQRHFLGALFALTHLAIATWASSRPSDGSWGYLPFVLPDLPVMLVLAFANKFLSLELGWPYIIVLGSAWWYSVGLWVTSVYRKRRRRSRPEG